MPDSRVPVDRPRSVVVAFWCWMTAAVLTTAFGMLVASIGMPVFFRVAGGLLAVVGLAQGYLAGRARNGKVRFARAAIGLALASVVVLALLLILGVAAILGVIIVAVIMVLLITGSVFTRRPSSQQWYESQDVHD